MLVVLAQCEMSTRADDPMNLADIRSNLPLLWFNLSQMDDQLEAPTSIIPKDQQDEDGESSGDEEMPDWTNIPSVFVFS